MAISKKKLLQLVILLSLFGLCSCARHSNPPPLQAPAVSIATIASLAGYWESKADSKGNKDSVIYKTTAGGSAVQEILFPGRPHEMISMYHQNNGKVQMTHYCMLGNQPTLGLIEANSGLDGQTMVFDLVGGTNMNPSTDDHMHRLKLTIIDKNHIRQEWIGYSGEKPNKHIKVINLERRG